VKKTSYWAIALLLFLVCKKPQYNPKLVDYFKAERALKKQGIQTQALKDSLNILQKRLNIDLDKELKKLEGNPESWISLLKALDNEK
jgi:hypothetical protein